MTFNTDAMPHTTEPWHVVSPEQTIELLQSDANRGLTIDEIYRRQQYFGANELKETGGRSTLTISDSKQIPRALRSTKTANSRNQQSFGK